LTIGFKFRSPEKWLHRGHFYSIVNFRLVPVSDHWSISVLMTYSKGANRPKADIMWLRKDFDVQA